MQFTETFPLTIDTAPAPLPPPLSITSGPLPNGAVGVPYGPFQLTGTGGTPFTTGAPYQFQATGLPAGLTLSPTYVISGTPTVGMISGGVRITILDSVG